MFAVSRGALAPSSCHYSTRPELGRHCVVVSRQVYARSTIGLSPRKSMQC
jgi:hypothetical protein